MGLLHGELNLLVKNLGIEDEDAISAKGKGKSRDEGSLFAFTPPKSMEGSYD